MDVHAFWFLNSYQFDKTENFFLRLYNQMESRGWL